MRLMYNISLEVPGFSTTHNIDSNSRLLHGRVTSDNTPNQVFIGKDTTLNIEGFNSNNTFIKDGSKIRIITYYNGADIDNSISDFCSMFAVICLLDNGNYEDYNVTTATSTSPFIDNLHYPYNFNYTQTTFISRQTVSINETDFQQLILVTDPNDDPIGCTTMNFTVKSLSPKKPTKLTMPKV
ncbi:1107_t:CDS:2 [Entrophospora sp. SA101]|nr:5290_t:CDS:2 [Entrophospora sp. SA101]CAJ0845459.1 1107_t:CDS:2 [Entrophospora sp. SA101]CAJ0907642.1 6660_t:CDS:2 [Entrophospora sp. SA101]